VRNQPNCRLYVGEIAFGNRPYELTSGHGVTRDGGETYEFQFRTQHELWHKERVLNRLIAELPHDWEYVAWVDADLLFARPDWALETVQLLQHYKVVQMFSHAQHLSPTHEVLQCKPPRPGFVYAWQNGLQPCLREPTAADNDYYPAFQFGHPGFAWGFRREALEQLGGLLDISILGSGDYHMALSFVHQLDRQLATGISTGYREQLQLWAERSRRYINRNIGYVPGAVSHYWHGNRKDRQYNSRWQILVDEQYDPEFDLKFDTQGLWQWTERNPELHYRVRNYFAARNEDDIHIY
jgi:hypothetical protein